MWFDFKITAKKSHFFLLVFITFTGYFVKTLQIEIIDYSTQSIEKFIEDLYDKDNVSQITNIPPLDNQFDKKLQIQNVPSSAVLMMKLISYYEDKFKIANHEPTERGTVVPLSVRIRTENNKINVSNKVMQRIGFKSKDRYANVAIPDVIIA